VEAPILILPNWENDFHVLMDASNLVIGAMLAQNLDNKCDQPITYASKLSCSIERNYMMTKKGHLP